MAYVEILAARQAADKCLSSRMFEIIKYKKDSFIVVKRLNSKSYVYIYSIAIYIFIYMLEHSFLSR